MNERCERSLRIYSKRISLYFHSEEKAKREEERGNEEGDAKEVERGASNLI